MFRRRLVIYLVLLLAAYAAICAFLYLRQDSMVFFPVRETVDRLKALARAENFSPWLNATGEQIGWQSAHGDPENALLIFHGNGGHALHRTYYQSITQLGEGKWKVFILEYPGYGARGGKPSEDSLTAAACEALDSLTTSNQTIWLLGESLGTGVACAAVARRPHAVAGLILLTPFESLTGAASHHYPWLPVSWFLRTRFDSRQNLPNYRGPVAFVLAGQDAVVPARLGRRLFDCYSGPKRVWEVPEAGHNDTGLLLAHWPEMAQWLRQQAIHNQMADQPSPTGPTHR